MPQKYSPEFKAKALQLIEEHIRAEQCSAWVACAAVGEALGRLHLAGEGFPLRRKNALQRDRTFCPATQKKMKLQTRPEGRQPWT